MRRRFVDAGARVDGAVGALRGAGVEYRAAIAVTGECQALGCQFRNCCVVIGGLSGLVADRGPCAAKPREIVDDLDREGGFAACAVCILDPQMKDTAGRLSHVVGEQR